MTSRVLLLASCFSVLLQSCSSARPNAVAGGDHPTGGHRPVVSAPTPLILEVAQGERRVRRFPGPAPLTIIKVDPQNGGSSDLMMAYNDIPPGGEIPAHWHKIADEIIFVHRGSGVVELGTDKRPFGTGATIYIPKGVRVAAKNTGSEPLSIVFVFSKPGFEEFLRETTVLEGQPVTQLSPSELTEIRKRHGWHMVWERP